MDSENNVELPDSRGSRLLENLLEKFRKDPDIDEYDFIPGDEPKNNCNPIVLVDHKLGIEAWAVRVLHGYAYSQLKKVIAARKKNPNSVLSNFQEALNLSKTVLMVQPEVSTAWNIRKELLLTCNLDIDHELKLGSLILRKFPKSPETFCHRKWLLEQWKLQHSDIFHDESPSTQPAESDCLNLASIDIEVPSTLSQNHNRPPRKDLPQILSDLVKRELVVCDITADKYPSNYNSWNHRIWVLSNIAQDHRDVLVNELAHSQNWISCHISDHSGFHYREHLLSKLCNSPFTSDEKQCDRLTQERDLNSEFIVDFPDHEAIWYHRRFVVHLLWKKLSSIGDQNFCQSKKSRLEPSHHSILEEEIEFAKLQEMKKGSKHIQRHAQNYKKWLHYTLDYNNSAQ